MVPSGDEAFIVDATLFRAVLLEEVEGDMAQDSHILSAVAFAQAGLILPESNIKDPMEAIFDLPMVSDSLSELVSLPPKGGDKEAPFDSN